MATVIDALVVTLGIDGRGMDSATVEAEKNLAKLREAAKYAKEELADAFAVMKKKDRYKGESEEDKLKGLKQEAILRKKLAKAVEDANKKVEVAEKKLSSEVVKGMKKVQSEAKRTATTLEQEGRKGAQFYGQLIAGATAFLAVVLGGSGLKSFITDTVESNAKLLRQSDILKVNIEDLGAWGNAVKLSGGTQEGFQTSVMGMGKLLTALGTKLRGARMAALALAQVGLTEVEVKGKDTFVVLEMLAEKFEHMDKLKALKMGQILRLDEGTILMLSQGKEKLHEIVEMMKKLGTPTREQAEASTQLRTEMLKLGIVNKAIGQIVLAYLVPAISIVVKKLTELAIWARENPKTIKQVFTSLAAGIAGAGIAALAAAPAVLAFAAPILVIGAAVALVTALLYELTSDWDKVGDDGVTTWKRLYDAVDYFQGAAHGLFLNFVDDITDGTAVILSVFTGDTVKMSAAWARFTGDMDRNSGNSKDFLEWLLEWVWVYGDWWSTYLNGKSFTENWAMIKRGADDVWLHVKAGAFAALDAIIQKLGGVAAGIAKLGTALGIPGAALALAGITAAQSAVPKEATRSLNEAVDYGIRSPNQQRTDIGERNARYLENVRLLASATGLHTPLRVSAATSLNASNVNNSRSSKSTTTTRIDNLNVNSHAVDAKGLVNDIRSEIENNGLVDQSDGGF